MLSKLVAFGHGIPALRSVGLAIRPRRLVVVWLLTALAVSGVPPVSATAGDSKLGERHERVDAQRRELSTQLGRAEAERARLDDALHAATARYDDVTAELNRLQDEISGIEREVAELEQAEATSRAHVAHRVGALYRGSAPNEFLGLLSGTSAADFADRSHYLTALTRADRSELEAAAAAGRRLAVRRADLVEATGRQEAIAQQARIARAELDRQLAVAGEAAAGVRAGLAARDEEARQIAGELEAQRRATALAQQRAADERAGERAPRRRDPAPSRSGGRSGPASTGAPSTTAPVPAPAPAPSPSQPASVTTACPQAQPRSFSDTWGAPRSGGRQHKGTDVFGAMGGDVFAITAGTIEWTRSGASAGLWLSLRGDDGDRYWYMHLSDFVASSGQRVAAGDLIAHNGNTGNARGASPHIHFEHHPGGGGPVNPYPLLRQVCG